MCAFFFLLLALCSMFICFAKRLFNRQITCVRAPIEPVLPYAISMWRRFSFFGSDFRLWNTCNSSAVVVSVTVEIIAIIILRIEYSFRVCGVDRCFLFHCQCVEYSAVLFILHFGAGGNKHITKAHQNKYDEDSTERINILKSKSIQIVVVSWALRS